MSPEGAIYAIEQYLQSLKAQAKLAEHFFFGRVGEGIEGLLNLPEEIKERIDQRLWEVTGGEVVDPTDESSGKLISDAILFSLEERMGMHA